MEVGLGITRTATLKARVVTLATTLGPILPSMLMSLSLLQINSTFNMHAMDHKPSRVLSTSQGGPDNVSEEYTLDHPRGDLVSPD